MDYNNEVVARPQKEFFFLISVSSKPNRLKVSVVAGFLLWTRGFGCLSPSKSSKAKKKIHLERIVVDNK